ncbi:MAG: CHAD domain-containing protein [Acidimicrobiales bacterium]
MAGAIGLATEQLLAHDPLIRLDAAAEDIHKARVATRRLRSDLQDARAVVRCVPGGGLRQELRWLGELLGNVRDADVLPLTIATRAEQLADVDRDAVAVIPASPGRGPPPALAVLRDVMGSARHPRPDRRPGAVLAQQPPLRPEVDPELAAPKVGRRGSPMRSAAARKRIERLPADAGLEPLHVVRKAAKRARYAAELTSVLSRGRTDDAADRLADLQDQLGAMVTVTAHQWLEASAGRTPIGRWRSPPGGWPRASPPTWRWAPTSAGAGPGTGPLTSTPAAGTAGAADRRDRPSAGARAPFACCSPAAHRRVAIGQHSVESAESGSAPGAWCSIARRAGDTSSSRGDS